MKGVEATWTNAQDWRRRAIESAARVLALETALLSQRQATEEAQRRAEAARRELIEVRRELAIAQGQIEARRHLARLQAEG